MVGQQIADNPAQHLPGRHPVLGSGRLEFEGLPPREKEGNFDHLLIQTGQARRNCFKHRMHDNTCAGNDDRPFSTQRPPPQPSPAGPMVRIRAVLRVPTNRSGVSVSTATGISNFPLFPHSGDSRRGGCCLGFARVGGTCEQSWRGPDRQESLAIQVPPVKLGQDAVTNRAPIKTSEF